MPKAPMPLWELVVRLLPARDPNAEWYRARDIAPLLGLKPDSILKHCRDLWPSRRAHYRLTKDEAELLVKRVCLVGRKLPEREAIEALLQEVNEPNK